MPAISLDLNLFDTYSLKSIGFADVSAYYNNTISNPSFEVTPPNFPKINLLFTPKEVNVFKSSDLIPGCPEDQDLPDGIYTIAYSVSPNITTKITKSFIRVAKTVAKLQKAYMAVELDCQCNKSVTDPQKRKLQEAKLLIEASISAANSCDIILAQKILGKASSLIDNNSKCNC